MNGGSVRPENLGGSRAASSPSVASGARNGCALADLIAVGCGLCLFGAATTPANCGRCRRGIVACPAAIVKPGLQVIATRYGRVNGKTAVEAHGRTGLLAGRIAVTNRERRYQVVSSFRPASAAPEPIRPDLERVA